MNKSNYEVQILVNGKAVKEYRKDNNTYVQGNIGTHYAIKVKNNGGRRVKAVVFVDGNSVLNDKNDNTGYIIDGYDSVTIHGFRTSKETEAEFIFSTKGDSRAQKVKGDARNCGAIGVKIYEEKERKPIQGYSWEIKKHCRPPYQQPSITPIRPTYVGDPYWTWTTFDGSYGDMIVANECSAKEISCSVQNNNVRTAYLASGGGENSAKSFSLGTEMGEDIRSSVEYVDFETGRLVSEFVIYYASRKDLQKMGINLNPQTKKVESMPDPFGNFCKRPK